MEQKLVQLTNEARQSHGLQPWKVIVPLSAAARFHSVEMGQTHEFSHDGPSGGPCERIRAAGGDEIIVAENISRSDAPDSQIPEQAIKDWLASPGHYANIMNGEYNAIGLGVARVQGSCYVTQVFADEKVMIESMAPDGDRLQVNAIVVEGPTSGAIMLHGTLVTRWQAGDDGRFQVSLPAAPDGTFKIAQETSHNHFEIVAEIPKRGSD